MLVTVDCDSLRWCKLNVHLLLDNMGRKQVTNHNECILLAHLQAAAKGTRTAGRKTGKNSKETFNKPSRNGRHCATLTKWQHKAGFVGVSRRFRGGFGLK